MEFNMTKQGFVTQTEYDELHISPDEEYGFRPYQLMVASIVGCSASVLRKVLTKMRMDFSDINISAQVERNEEEASRIERIRLHFVIVGKNLRKEKVERALALSRKNCAMVQSVEGRMEVEETFELEG